MLKGTNLLTIYDYVKLYIGYFSNRFPVWEGIFTLNFFLQHVHQVHGHLTIFNVLRWINQLLKIHFSNFTFYSLFKIYFSKFTLRNLFYEIYFWKFNFWNSLFKTFSNSLFWNSHYKVNSSNFTLQTSLYKFHFLKSTFWNSLFRFQFSNYTFRNLHFKSKFDFLNLLLEIFFLKLTFHLQISQKVNVLIKNWPHTEINLINT